MVWNNAIQRPKVTTSANLVETTWLTRYTWPIEITFDQGAEFIGRQFKNSLLENGNGLKENPDSSGNPQMNTIIEIMYQVLGNLIWTYNLQETYVNQGWWF